MQHWGISCLKCCVPSLNPETLRVLSATVGSSAAQMELSSTLRIYRGSDRQTPVLHPQGTTRLFWVKRKKARRTEVESSHGERAVFSGSQARGYPCFFSLCFTKHMIDSWTQPDFQGTDKGWRPVSTVKSRSHYTMLMESKPPNHSE